MCFEGALTLHQLIAATWRNHARRERHHTTGSLTKAARTPTDKSIWGAFKRTYHFARIHVTLHVACEVGVVLHACKLRTGRYTLACSQELG